MSPTLADHPPSSMHIQVKKEKSEIAEWTLHLQMYGLKTGLHI